MNEKGTSRRLSCTTTALQNLSFTFPLKRLHSCNLKMEVYPGLHISLGIFDCLYNLLVDACHEFDCLVAEENAGGGKAGTSFSQYQDACRQRSEVQKSIGHYRSVISKDNMSNINPNHPIVQQCKEAMSSNTD